MASPRRTALPRKPQPRRATSQLFRRTSLDQLVFEQPQQHSASGAHEHPTRSASSWSRTIPTQPPTIQESGQDQSSSKRSRFGFLSKRSDDTNAQNASNLPRTPPRSPVGQHAARPSFSSIDQVPTRKSSLVQIHRTASSIDKDAISNTRQPLPAPPPPGFGGTIPLHGSAMSPVRAVSSQINPMVMKAALDPLRTFRRPVVPMDIVEMPEIRENGFSLGLKLDSPVFTGGGTIEGNICVVAEFSRLRARPTIFSSATILPNVSVSRLTIDVLGIERCRERKHIFQSLAMELIDGRHPPPRSMISNFDQTGPDWDIAPSTTQIPFCLSLPINVGPPPYKTKAAKVQYLLAVTASIKIGARACYVRTSREIDVLTVRDPETTLVNLKTPLVISDTLQFNHYGKLQQLKLLAGIHRQTWVSGSPMYADILISNKTYKHVKRFELFLEKVTLFYGPSTAQSDKLDKVSESLRVPIKTQKEIVARRCTKADSRLIRHGWLGTLPNTQDQSTCMLEVPTGLVTIETGRFFKVRYFLTVQVSFSGKKATVQIPVTIIHPNSLDIVPNALAQVAKAIETERRVSTGRKDPFVDGSQDRDLNQDRTQQQPKYSTPYNIARRRSLEYVGSQQVAKEVRPRKPVPSQTQLIRKKLEPASSFAPLRLNFPEPPTLNGKLYLTSPLVTPRLKTQSEFKSPVDLEIHRMSIKALTRELKASPKFQKRKSQDENAQDGRIKASIMSRPRPWAREEPEQEVRESIVARPYSPEVQLEKVVEEDLGTLSGRISGWDRFRPSHAFQYKANDCDWTQNTRKVSVRLSMSQENDWEDLDSDEADGMGFGPGPDVGGTSHRTRPSMQHLGHHLRIPSSDSNSSMRRRRRVSYLPSNHGRSARRESNDPWSTPNSLKRRGVVYDTYKRGLSPVPQYQLRRSTGNARFGFGRIAVRNITKNPFFHGSGRLVTTNVTRDRSLSDTGRSGPRPPPKYRIRRDRSLDHSFGSTTRHAHEKKLGSQKHHGDPFLQKIQAHDNLVPQIHPRHEDRELRTMRPKEALNTHRHTRSDDVLELPSPNPPLATPKTAIPEVLPGSSNYSKTPGPSQTSSKESFKDFKLPPAAEFGARIQEWRIQNSTYSYNTHQVQPSQTTTDYAEYLASPPGMSQSLQEPSPSSTSKSGKSQASTVVNKVRSASCGSEAQEVHHSERASNARSHSGRGPSFESRQLQQSSRPPAPSSVKSVNSTASSRTTQPKADPKDIAPTGTSPHLHSTSTSTAASRSTSHSNNSTSRPPPSHPHSNVLSPIAESSVGGTTPRARAAPLRPGLRLLGLQVQDEKPDRKQGYEIYDEGSRKRSSSQTVISPQGVNSSRETTPEARSAVPSPLAVTKERGVSHAKVDDRIRSRGDGHQIPRERGTSGQVDSRGLTRLPGERRASLEDKDSNSDKKRRQERANRKRMEWLEGLGFAE